MRRAAVGLTAVLAIGAAGLAAGGCGTTVTPDTTLAELLNQITVGDVVNAFTQFVGQIQNHHGMGGFGRRELTDEQTSQIEALQAQLDAGEITREQFEQQVRNIIGDFAPRMAFAGYGFFGAPFGNRLGHGQAGFFNLSDEQKAAARTIFENLHTDIGTLRSDAHARIREVLTPGQQAKLDELQSRRFGRFGMLRGHHGGETAHGARGRRPFVERFAEELGLSDEQKAQIETIRTELRTAIEARHQQAREEFRNLLTPEQLALLDAYENVHSEGPGAEGG